MNVKSLECIAEETEGCHGSEPEWHGGYNYDEVVEAGEVEDFVFAVFVEFEYWIHLIDG